MPPLVFRDLRFYLESMYNHVIGISLVTIIENLIFPNSTWYESLYSRVIVSKEKKSL